MKNLVYEMYNEEHFNRFINEIEEFCKPEADKNEEKILTEYFRYEKKLYNLHLNTIKRDLNKGYNVYIILHKTNGHMYMSPFGYTTESTDDIILKVNALDVIHFFTLRNGLNNTQPIILSPDNVRNIVTKLNDIETDMISIKKELGLEVKYEK